MSLPETALVVTTIFPPAFLEGYLQQVREHGREHPVRLIVIIDPKPPPGVAEACPAARQAGLRVDSPPLDEQTAFLSRLGVPGDWIPFDTDNRRNVGYLMALDGKGDL